MRLRRGQEEEWAQERLREGSGGAAKCANIPIPSTPIPNRNTGWNWAHRELRANWRLFTEQVETLLKTQEISSGSDGAKGLPISIDAAAKQPLNQRAAATANFNVTDPSIGIASSRDMDRWHFNPDSPNAPLEDFNFNGGMNMGMGGVDNNFTWEMIGLGLEEPLPPQETIDEL
jgi:hypothetical protein